QDSKHALKTFQNNIFTGAQVLTLGSFNATYQHVHGIAMQPNSPLYNCDVIKYNKQDDNTASQIFSADTLEKAMENTEDYLGLIVYLFVFGEFVDALQSCMMAHKHHVQIALRTKLFLDTWK
ncbi:hypothetical protein IW261DRAFT_1311793, partial [Armillaria novae-zelandiae]